MRPQAPSRQLALPMNVEIPEALLRAAHAACGLSLPFEEAMASPTGIATALKVVARAVWRAPRGGGADAGPAPTGALYFPAAGGVRPRPGGLCWLGSQSIRSEPWIGI